MKKLLLEYDKAGAERAIGLLLRKMPKAISWASQLIRKELNIELRDKASLFKALSGDFSELQTLHDQQVKKDTQSIGNVSIKAELEAIARKKYRETCDKVLEVFSEKLIPEMFETEIRRSTPFYQSFVNQTLSECLDYFDLKQDGTPFIPEQTANEIIDQFKLFETDPVKIQCHEMHIKAAEAIATWLNAVESLNLGLAIPNLTDNRDPVFQVERIDGKTSVKANLINLRPIPRRNYQRKHPQAPTQL